MQQKFLLVLLLFLLGLDRGWISLKQVHTPSYEVVVMQSTKFAFVAVISGQLGVNTCFRKLMRKAGIKIYYTAKSMVLRENFLPCKFVNYANIIVLVSA